jgi:hypothetical protein
MWWSEVKLGEGLGEMCVQQLCNSLLYSMPNCYSCRYIYFRFFVRFKYSFSVFTVSSICALLYL